MLEEMADRVEGREHQVGSGLTKWSELIRRKLRGFLAGEIARETAAWSE